MFSRYFMMGFNRYLICQSSSFQGFPLHPKPPKFTPEAMAGTLCSYPVNPVTPARDEGMKYRGVFVISPLEMKNSWFILP